MSPRADFSPISAAVLLTHTKANAARNIEPVGSFTHKVAKRTKKNNQIQLCGENGKGLVFTERRNLLDEGRSHQTPVWTLRCSKAFGEPEHWWCNTASPCQASVFLDFSLELMKLQ